MMYFILTIVVFNVCTCAFGIPMILNYWKELKNRDIYISDVFIWLFILLVSPALIITSFLAGIILVLSKLFGWLLKNANKVIIKKRG